MKSAPAMHVVELLRVGPDALAGAAHTVKQGVLGGEQVGKRAHAARKRAPGRVANLVDANASGISRDAGGTGHGVRRVEDPKLRRALHCRDVCQSSVVQVEDGVTFRVEVVRMHGARARLVHGVGVADDTHVVELIDVCFRDEGRQVGSFESRRRLDGLSTPRLHRRGGGAQLCVLGALDHVVHEPAAERETREPETSVGGAKALQ